MNESAPAPAIGAKPARRRGTQRGFALLEAIVALAILAAVGMALFAAINQTVQLVGRAETAREADSALLNAVAWLQTVNPSQQPEGTQQLDDVQLHWTSQLVEPALDGSTNSLVPGLYKIGLYDMHLELRRGDVVLADATVRKVGYVQVREPGLM